MKKFLIVSFLFTLLVGSNTFAQAPNDYAKINKDLAVFADVTGLKLKKKVNKKTINSIANPVIKEVASAILQKKYHPKYKYATYHAILNPRTLGHDLSIGDGYSKYENVTGVYLEKGAHIILVDGIAEGREVKLFVPNWLRKAPNPEKPTEDLNGWGLHKKEFVIT